MAGREQQQQRQQQHEKNGTILFSKKTWAERASAIKIQAEGQINPEGPCQNCLKDQTHNMRRGNKEALEVMFPECKKADRNGSLSACGRCKYVKEKCEQPLGKGEGHQKGMDCNCGEQKIVQAG